jgi:flagellar basal-body rod modification protein FlgD
MPVPAVDTTTQTPVSNGLYTSTSSASSADKDMFLNLMVAQLRYQDPMNPADSSEFLSQNAQFTALEKMQDVADQTAALLQSQTAFGAAGMVGKTVSYVDAKGATATGKVDSVSFDASGPMLVIGGTNVSLAQVSSISTTATTGTTTTGTATTGTTTSGSTGTSTSPTSPSTTA